MGCCGNKLGGAKQANAKLGPQKVTKNTPAKPTEVKKVGTPSPRDVRQHIGKRKARSAVVHPSASSSKPPVNNQLTVQKEATNAPRERGGVSVVGSGSAASIAASVARRQRLAAARRRR